MVGELSGADAGAGDDWGRVDEHKRLLRLDLRHVEKVLRAIWRNSGVCEVALAGKYMIPAASLLRAEGMAE